MGIYLVHARGKKGAVNGNGGKRNTFEKQCRDRFGNARTLMSMSIPRTEKEPRRKSRFKMIFDLVPMEFKILASYATDIEVEFSKER